MQQQYREINVCFSQKTVAETDTKPLKHNIKIYQNKNLTGDKEKIIGDHFFQKTKNIKRLIMISSCCLISSR